MFFFNIDIQIFVASRRPLFKTKTAVSLVNRKRERLNVIVISRYLYKAL
jgi:hypothetical protein